MSFLVADVIQHVRDFLDDNDSTRYSDDLITRSIKRGVAHFSLHTEIIRDWADTVESTECPYTYLLPKDVLVLTRATCEGLPLKVVSRSQMDSYDRRWESRTAKRRVTHLVYDDNNKREIRLYPSPLDVNVYYFDSASPYGVLTIPANEAVGAFHDVDSLNVDETLCPQEQSDQYGILADLDLFKIDLNFYFTRTARWDGTTIELDEEWMEAIVHYTLSSMLRADRDDTHRTLGNSERQLYDEEVKKAKSLKSISHTRTAQYETEYRTLRR